MTKEIDPKTVDLLHQNMKCRLYDVVGEYLDDDNYSPLTFYTDLIDSIIDWEEYHRKKLKKASSVLGLINDVQPKQMPSIIHFNSKVNDTMPPWGHSDMEALRYTEEELNAMCNKAASDQEKARCQEYNLREAEYYNQRAKMDITTKKDWDEFWEHK
jgi:hypothetical protein